ncbi:RNA-binding transcriptional accessory protein [Permianibacter sp. IMCC34836]|uniref:Tex family protein n=1 Tax=Permianibacter fluminis TaxID=2738515 RepID=UPI001554B07C|nr:Tex family protein [Permianibacter fluminis]NQD35644.1 RNA-binding transcriptional accessory protein [Permianibacter fluminis]
MLDIAQRIAAELNVRPQQVNAAVALLDEGATVPFISRYRKEVTGGLTDTDLRNLEERLGYLRELEDRRGAILKSIADQGKLTPELEGQIRTVQNKTELEDLYLPYKPKRRTKGQIAREAGLEPLALALHGEPSLDPQAEAAKYVDADKGVADVTAALEGARYILMEDWADDAALLAKLRTKLNQTALVASKMVEGKEQEGAKFRDYFAFSEQINKIPSHRALALFRGRNEGVLTLTLVPQQVAEGERADAVCEMMVAEHVHVADKKRPADAWLMQTAQWTWRIKLATKFETELFNDVRERAEADAIRVFASNLRDLLMAAPAGAKTTMGLDPGLRTGVKCVVVDDTGKLLHYSVIYPHQPQNEWNSSLKQLYLLCAKFNVGLISIGNGTASRETDKLAGELLKNHPEIKATKVVVSEAGASVYSASELAANEFPDLDVSYRGAVSIARRLQDPLAELVKIDPKSIGVGQYQHDVSQAQLAKMLDSVVEDCVNAVGVDVNTASVPLLAKVSGLNRTLASNIVAFRDKNGRFKSRADLLKVDRLGERTFEQAAGFLRVIGGDNPLDASAVHPEAYPVVEKILAKAGKNSIKEVMGNVSFLRTLKVTEYTDEKFGAPTVTDIVTELEKPGRDPRGEFKTATFKDGVENLSDLKVGMQLEGSVTNVTDFGAFIDIGVHQDGLAHISQLADRFIKDPREAVKAGDVVKVTVMEVDIPRKRIALSLRSDALSIIAQGGTGATPKSGGGKQPTSFSSKPKQDKPASVGGFGALLADAMKKK